jgi:hypothetical protein
MTATGDGVQRSMWQIYNAERDGFGVEFGVEVVVRR